VLAILYSQTGQLSAVAEQTLAPMLADSRISVHLEILKPSRRTWSPKNSIHSAWTKRPDSI